MTENPINSSSDSSEAPNCVAVVRQEVVGGGACAAEAVGANAGGGGDRGTEGAGATARGGAISLLGAVLLHAAGVIVVAAIMALALVGTTALHTIGQWQLESHTWLGSEWVQHLVVSGLVWGLLYMAVRRFARYQKTPRVRLAGTVLTETLIVLPAFFALFTLLVQISLNNIMGMLASVAAHQAARTVWVWQPEIGKPRSGVSPGDVAELARIQAAMVMLPVGQTGFQNQGTPSGSRVQAALSVVAAPHAKSLTQSSSSQYRSQAMAAIAGDGNAANAKETSFFRSFDVSSFQTRAPIKFMQAYNALSNSKVASEGDMVGYRLEYKYISTFPFYGLIAEGKLTGDLTIKRNFFLPRQTAPNPNLP